MKAVLTSVAFAAAGGAVLAAVAVVRWLEPSAPLLYAAATVVPLALAVIFVFHPELRGPEGRGRAVGAGLVATVVALGLAGLWHSPQVRAAVVGAAPSQIELARVLDDPHPAVRMAGCRQLFAARPPAGVADALAERPTLAVRCLQAIGTTPDALTVTELLERRWHGRLADADDADAIAARCAEADGLAALGVDEAVRAADLLDCAVRAPQSAVRGCCLDNLQAMAPDCQALAERVDPDRLAELDTASVLVALAYGEQTSTEHLSEVTRRLDLSCDAMQMLGVQLACHAVADRDAQGSRRAMQWLFESRDSCLDTDEREALTDTAALCDQLLVSIRRLRAADNAQICQARQRVARRELAADRAAEADADDGGQLAAGIAGGAGATEPSLAEFVDSLAGRDGSRSLADYSTAQRQALLRRLHAQTQPEGFDPSTAAANLKEVEAMADQKLGNPAAQAQMTDEQREVLEAVAAESPEQMYRMLEDTGERYGAARAAEAAKQGAR